jgi:hypothetical protein
MLQPWLNIRNSSPNDLQDPINSPRQPIDCGCLRLCEALLHLRHTMVYHCQSSPAKAGGRHWLFWVYDTVIRCYQYSIIHFFANIYSCTWVSLIAIHFGGVINFTLYSSQNAEDSRNKYHWHGALPKPSQINVWMTMHDLFFNIHQQSLNLLHYSLSLPFELFLDRQRNLKKNVSRKMPCCFFFLVASWRHRIIHVSSCI